MYNIRYGTGGGRLLFPWSGYFRKTEKTLQQLIDFIQSLNPDIAGLIEVDAGSFRSSGHNQAERIAERLGHYHAYKSKYGESRFTGNVPLMSSQGNAFLARDSISNATFHYFKRGVKRLVIELELEELTVFLVHLALTFKVRHHQLKDLYDVVNNTSKPHIVAGDFNAKWGDHEIGLFLAATGLVNADVEGGPTYPSWSPRRQLDFILHSPEINVTRFWKPDVKFSDHLPLVLDFQIDRQRVSGKQAGQASGAVENVNPVGS